MNKKGFTLIELIIYTFAFVIAAVLLTSFILNLIKIKAKTQIEKGVLVESQRAMETMLLEIRHAQDIYSSTSLFNSHPGQLSLKTVRNTPDDEEITYLDFYLDDNNRLAFKKEGRASEALTSENVKINNLVFRYLTAGEAKSIQIELLAVYNGPTEKAYYQATTTLISSANLRND